MKRGFSLMEVAIVLAIVGLMAGAVVGAQSMMRASQLRGALAEYDSYLKSIGEFTDKYYALPGDMSNAEASWGADDSCPNTAANSVAKILTCNGDGNGHIGDSTTAGVLSDSREWFRAWQQLSNAGFVQQRFSGTPGVGDDEEALVGVNVPKSALGGAGWTLMYLLMTSDDILWADAYGHILVLGAATANSYTSGAALTGAEARSLDAKIDDSKPGLGKVRAFRTSLLADCTTSDSSQSAQAYATSDSARVCSLVFVPGI